MTRRDPRANGTPTLGTSYFKLFGASTVSNLGDGLSFVAYPWLASAVTRNPALIALIAVVQRLPWLVLSLPIGVLTDRHDRRRLMIGANTARALLATAVAFAVLARQGSLLAPDVVADADSLIRSDAFLYIVLVLATFALGVAEVVYDNSAQTFLPSIVHRDTLEKANGRLWSAEMVANTFVGPPLAAFLIAVTYSLPFFVDAATFAVSAVLIASIPRPVPASSEPAEPRRRWTEELGEGFRWLWGHDLLRALAITLGLLNLLGTMSTATFVLFGQEVLGTTAFEFALLTTGGAVGGIVAGWTASNVARRLGDGASLWVTLVGGGALTILIGLSSWWPVAWVLFAVYVFTTVLWNVITVSFRQTVIPDHLLGRVNSVYRFFGWGMIPIGAALGGIVVVASELVMSRESALRMPWVIAGAASIALIAYAGPRLTNQAFASARAAASGDADRAPSSVD